MKLGVGQGGGEANLISSNIRRFLIFHAKLHVFGGLGALFGTFFINCMSFFLNVPHTLPHPRRGWTSFSRRMSANSRWAPGACDPYSQMNAGSRCTLASGWRSARSTRVLTRDANSRRAPATRAPASLNLRCRPPTQLVVDSDSGRTLSSYRR